KGTIILINQQQLIDQIELQSHEVNTRKINLGTIKIQLLGVIETIKLINKTDSNETTQYILRQLQGLTDIIQQDLHVIGITGELPEQHNDRFIEESQEPDLSQYNLATSQDSKVNKSEPWTNFDTYEEYITQTKKQLIVQVLKAKEYFAKELIRIIVKNWKYDYPREQFEETEENLTALMIKEHDNFELADLKSKIRLTKNECLQYYLSTLRTRQFRKMIQLSTKEEERGKMNNIFDKPSKEGILKILKQDPYTTAKKKNQLTKEQYQDWQQQ
ncbi:24545_t:CDS:2, partial [Gigaspora margarita]